MIVLSVFVGICDAVYLRAETLVVDPKRSDTFHHVDVRGPLLQR